MPGSVVGWTYTDLFDGGTGYVSIGTNVLYKTRNGGDTWTTLAGPEGVGEISRLSFASPEHGYISDGSLVFRTTDGGESWEPLPDPPEVPGAVSPLQIDSLEARPGTKKLLATAWTQGNDCGQARIHHVILRFSRGDWVFKSLQYAASTYEVEFLNGSDGLMLVHRFERADTGQGECASVIRTSSSYVLLTRDGGKTWKRIYEASLADDGAIWAVAMPSTRRIVLGTKSGTVLLSTNSGRDFSQAQRLKGTSAQGILDALAFGSRRVGYAGTNGIGMWRTVDGGRTWTLESSPFDSIVADDSTFRGSISAVGPVAAIASGPGSIAKRDP